VGFVPQQADVNLTSSCAATSIAKDTTTDCTITTTNNSPADAVVSTSTTVNNKLKVVSATGATRTGSRSVSAPTATLGGSHPGVPSVAAGSSPYGFNALLDFGFTPDAFGDETIAKYDVPDFVYNGRTYNTLAVDSNGYVVAGGEGNNTENECCSVVLPAASTPNNLIAPFWTDLDGTGTPGVTVGTVGDGVNNWLIVEWDVNVWGTQNRQHLQAWIGIDGFQDVTYTYNGQPTDPGQPWAIGAENSEGAGQALAAFPTGDVVVTSTAPTAGGSQSYTVKVKGDERGTGIVTSTMDSPSVSGSTIVRSTVTVTKR
jgi:hypothetical protein